MQSSKKITKGFIEDFISDSTLLALSLKADLNSPTFTGDVVVPIADSPNEAVNLGQVTSLISTSALFTADIPVVLSGGKSLGKYTTGQTIPAIGKTAQQVITDIALEYINPSFSSFLILGQAITIEVGTILSGNKTFNWSIVNNSGIVNLLDIFDNTTTTNLVVNIPNSGSANIVINTIQLNSEGAIQSWKGVAHNTTPPGNINSSNFIVTARFVRWWGPVASYPANPTDQLLNRSYALALPNSAFKTPGANTFTLVTGTIQNRFIVLLPPGIFITSVVDTTNANTNITTNYILSVCEINDAGGTERQYNMYQYTNAIPYSISANHVITTT